VKLPDSRFYDKVWQRARQSSSLHKQTIHPGLWQSFWDQFAPTYLKICRSLQPAIRKLVASWKEKGCLDEQSRVLDIGCGPGTFTLPLAEGAGEVVGLDTSPGMLSSLQKEARQKGLANVKPLEKDWGESSFQKEFDLVVAASSPVISNRESLLKMNSASREWCLFTCPAGSPSRTLRHQLWEEIMGKKMEGRSFDISFPFNILYLEGYFPRLDFETLHYCYFENSERVFQNYRSYFQIFDKKGPSVDSIIERCVKSWSHNGYVEERISYKMAVMWWNVNEKG